MGAAPHKMLLEGDRGRGLGGGMISEKLEAAIGGQGRASKPLGIARLFDQWALSGRMSPWRGKCVNKRSATHESR